MIYNNKNTRSNKKQLNYTFSTHHETRLSERSYARTNCTGHTNERSVHTHTHMLCASSLLFVNFKLKQETCKMINLQYVDIHISIDRYICIIHLSIIYHIYGKRVATSTAGVKKAEEKQKHAHKQAL